ncbi:hypothetical protein GCM10007205_05270 [Oxalicibacterium flavum]|uniref:Uncharacterized protein n=1 Tax=Oxalicibacterium flavum TaxID=179467 RepID=A0A8J2UJG7_9BURK|nr:helix-turn-helix domain-containing protein [Oxalicibacterium flavum]GGB98925.1 hypothetical protein GCM10007205_05270 [Oxalicibacterium flavum]
MQDASQQTDGLDPAKVTILRQLWEASQESDGAWSLAKLSKRAGIPMSTLLRILNEFDTAGIVDLTEQEDGRRFAALNADGLALFPSLFSTQ